MLAPTLHCKFLHSSLEDRIKQWQQKLELKFSIVIDFILDDASWMLKAYDE